VVIISYAQNTVELFRHSRQFYYMNTDGEGKLTYTNPLFNEKFSYLHHEFTGISIENIIYPADLGQYHKVVESCLQAPGKPQTVDLRHPSSNGHLYHSRLEVCAIATNQIQIVGTDITDLHSKKINGEPEALQSSTDLQQANRELNEILENASEAIVKIDLGGRMVYMTREFFRITGYNESDVLGKRWQRFIHPEDLRVCIDAMSKVVLQRQVVRSIRYRLRDKSDTYHWFSTSATLVLDHAGEPLHVICFTRDVTERKYVEDALQASEERYRMFIEQSSEAIWRYEMEEPIFIDTDDDNLIGQLRSRGFVAECNDIMAAMYGHQVSSQMIGVRLDDLMDLTHPRNIELLQAFIRNDFRLTDAESYEFDAQGNTRYFVNNLIGIIENGYLKRIWGTQRDITEKKQIEEKSRYLARLTENVSDSIISGDLDLRIVSCNPAAEQLLGFSAQQLIGRKLQELITINYHNTDRENIIRQVFEKGSWVGEASFTRVHDQKLVTFFSSISLIKDADGKAMGVVAINKDITDTKSALETARHLATLVENTTDVLTSADLDFHVISWNKAAERVYGITAQKVIGKNLRDLIEISYQDITRDDVRRILLEKGEWRGEMYFTRPTDNKPITLLMNFTLQRDAAGNPAGYVIGGTDITERKQAELRIKESEERFRLVADSAPVMMWMCDANNKTIYVNKPWQRFTGRTIKQILKETWSSVVHPEDVGAGSSEFDEHFRKREPVRMVYRIRTYEGAYRWVLDIGIPRLLDDGTFLGYIGSVIDIHDQKLKEDQLLYQAKILENVSDGVVITDLNFNVMSWNKVAEDMFGITAEEAIGNKLTGLVKFDYGVYSFKQVLQEFDKKGRWKGEASFINRRGEKKFLLNTVSLISDDEGHNVSVMLVGSDISELKKAQVQLQESEVFYRSLIGNSLDGILLTDAQANITFSAPSLKNILGYEAEEVAGTNIFAYVHPEDRRLAEHRFFEPTEPGAPEFIVIRLLKKTNEWLWCAVRGADLLNNPQINAFVVYLHDDTLRKKAEDELKESERRLRTAQQIAGLGYMELSQDNKLYCTSETINILGTKQENLHDLASFLALIHPADRKKIREDIQSAIKAGGSFEHEFRIQPAESQEKIIQSIGTLIHESASGRVILKITIQDVTNIRAAQLALRTSESRFRSLFEHSIDGILLTQPGGAVKSANPAICEMLGYTKEEILQQKRRDIFDFNDPQFSRILETREESGRFKGELALIHKSGKKIACEVSSVLFRDSEGRAYHSTIIRDITRQKEAEQQLKKRETVLSAIAEATNRLILEDKLDNSINYSIELIGKIVGADRAYIFENHADKNGEHFTSQRYEWCAENIIAQAGKSSSQNVPFTDFMPVITLLRENKPFTAFTNSYENETLKKRWHSQQIVSLLILPIFMQGNLWGFVGFDECHYEREWQNWEIDILKAFGSSLAGAIERNKAEHELSETNARLGIALNDLNKILDYSQDVICSFDDNGDFLQVSAASERIWGYKPKEVIGRNFKEFILPEDIINTSALIERMKAGESVATNFENHFQRKDGSLVILDWSAYWYEKEKIAFCVARDITLQKEIEQQLIASESRFRSFMDNSPAAAWICDEEGRYVYLNKFLATHLSADGYNSIGKTMFELYEPAYANLYHENNMQVLRQNYPLEVIEKGIRTDGSENVMLVYKFPVLIGPGQRGVGGVAIDITDKTRAEEALRTSEQNLKAIFTSTRDAFFLLDKKLRLVSYNPIGAELYSMFSEGAPIDEYADILTILPPERQEVLRGHIHKAFQGESLEYEIMYTFGGQPRWFYLVIRPVTGRDGQVDAICATISNITSKKSAEQKIKETAEQLTSIMETISDGMFILDKDLVIQYMNNAAEKMLRFRREDVIGPDRLQNRKKLADAVNLEPSIFKLYYKKAFLEKKAVHFEKYIVAIQTWFEIDAYPVGDGLTIYFRDITARKRQEMTLSLEKRVLEMNALPESSLAETITNFLKGIEQIYPDMLCSVLLHENQTIKPIAGPSIPEEFTKLINGVAIGPKVGSCGTAIFLRKAVYVSDIATDPLWEDFRDIALRFNLRACWSIPIINARNEVLACFAIYYNKPKEPRDFEMRAIERAADILRVIIENKYAEDHIRVTNQRYHFVTKATNEAIWDLDLASNQMYWAEGYYTLFGYDSGTGAGSLDQSHQRIHAQDLKRIKTSLQNFLRRKTKTRWEDEYRYRKSDGSYAYVLDKAYLINDSEGRPMRMIGSMQDITSRKELEQKLIEQEIGKQKMLTQATIDGQEKERKEIGKELHDNINQILSTTKLYLDLAQNTAEGNTAELITISSRNIMEAINEIRKLSRSLVPPTLGDLGLIESIKDLCDAFISMKTFNIDFVHRNVREKHVPDNQKLMLFRIIQEQTNNIVKHAKASNVKIELKASKGILNLEIADDGRGFDPAKTKKGVGLNNIVNRVELFNGTVDIIAVPGQGCTVRVAIPVKY
jgi:PAS domain S-box-containing protein